MQPDLLVPVRVKDDSAPDYLAWANDRLFKIPRSVVEKNGLSSNARVNGELILTYRPQVTWGDVELLRSRAAFTLQRPVTSRLPFHYHRFPTQIRSMYASLVGRLQRHRSLHWADFPGWPIDLSSDYLADLAEGGPSGVSIHPTPVVLTHDIDSSEGLQNLVSMFLDIEETVGARSTNYIVPCGWPIDHKLMKLVAEHGHAWGIHGYNHANLTPFLDATQLQERLQGARSLAKKYDMQGYRAPSLLRTPQLLANLTQFYLYDSSIPTSGGLFPIPNNGCASARPFVIEGILEIPVSMPRDGSLRFLGYTPGDIVALWKECADYISLSGGVVVLLTHCETHFSGNRPMIDAYQQFIEYIASSQRYAFSTMAEVVEFCRPIQRGNLEAEDQRDV